MHEVPFYRPSIGEAEISDVISVLRSGWLTTGPKAKEFEACFASYVRRAHAVAVNSCTAALHLALEAIGLKAGQAVLVPTMTFAATAEVVRYFDATPVLIDCRPEDLNMDVNDAALRLEAVRARGLEPVAVIAVHYGGQIGDIPALRTLARRNNLRLIEDAAHCCPAFYRENAHAPWKPAGEDAAISCYSFYANKNITTGEGGMACTDSAAYADRMRVMSLHGISRDAWKRYTAEGSWHYEIVAPGYKYNLTDVAAALGLRQLRRAEELHFRRTQWAQRYTELLGDVPELILPVTHPDRIHSWHLYSVRLDPARCPIDRAAMIDELKQHRIGASVHWMPLHLHPYYREMLDCRPEEFPCATAVYPTLLSLPLYPEMTETQVDYVCHTLKAILARARTTIPISPPRVRTPAVDRIAA